MSNAISGLNAYQQTAQIYQKSAAGKSGSSKAAAAESTVEKAFVSTSTSLTPVYSDSYGYVIGDVKLSEEAEDYYTKLKAKFGNFDFILVSKDMKAQVQANAASYGNANKMVVLIDEEKLERMATDESYRKKYEGIIAMAEYQLSAAKNSLSSSGASVKNFGMSVSSDGTTSFFATLEKSSKAQAERIKKKAEEKKAEKKAAEKKAEKEEKEAAIKERQEEIKVEGESLEELLRKVQNIAYEQSGTLKTEQEKAVGQYFDFQG